MYRRGMKDYSVCSARAVWITTFARHHVTPYDIFVARRRLVRARIPARLFASLDDFRLALLQARQSLRQSRPVV